MKSGKGYEAVLVAALLAASLIVRTADLDVFIASDELRWTCRSLLFRDALTRGAWAETFTVGHPGVITMWLGALTLPSSERAVETCVRSDGVEHISATAETRQEQTQRLAELGRLLPHGRLGVGVFTWLCLILVWALVRSAVGPGVALLSVAILGLDPFLVAHSRVLHLDAVTAMLSLVAVVGLLSALNVPPAQRRRRLALAVSGVAAGLAMLEKSPALLLGPFAALSLGMAAVAPLPTAWREWKTQRDWSQLATQLLIWGGLAVIVYVALWPAMWVEPLTTIRRMLAKATGYALGGHEPGNFFFGRISDDPGPLFYPVALAFRLTPVALLGLAGVVYGLARRSWTGATSRAPIPASAPVGRSTTCCAQRERRAAVVCLAFALVFVAFMTAGAKKFDRYVLPTSAAIDLAAAIGLVWLGRAAARRYTRLTAQPGDGPPVRARAAFLASACVGVVALVTAVAHHPYYLTAYNPLLGGERGARRAILVGWGEGYDQVAAYLNAQPGASNAEAATPGVSNLMPLFVGETRSMSSFRPWRSDYIVFYVSHVQRDHDPEVLERYLFNPEQVPEHVVRLAGIDYAWIYRNDTWSPPLDAIVDAARPGDALMTNGTSLIRKHYTGDLPGLYVYGHWGGPETAELLAQVPSDISRIWYARYIATDPRPIQQTLHRRAVLEHYEPFPDVELYLYRLVKGAPDALDSPVGYGETADAPVLQLTGAGIADDVLRWGQDNLIRLAWQLVEPTDADYRVRLQLTGSDGYVWAETEGTILNAELAPTSEWTAGDVGTRHVMPTVDGYRLTPPAGLPPGKYWLKIDVLSLSEGDVVRGDASPTGSPNNPDATSPVGARHALPLSEAAGPVGPVASTAEATVPVQVGQPAAQPEWDNVAPSGMQRLDAQLDQMRLVGVELGADPAAAGETLPVGLIWEMDATPAEETQLELRLEGLNGVTWADWHGRLRTADQRWVRSGHNLALDPSAGGVGRLLVSVNGGAEVPISLVDVVQPETHFEPPAAIQHRTDYRLEGHPVAQAASQPAVRLIGFDVSDAVVAAGDSLGVTLYWQADGALAPAQKVFVHLVGADGQLYSQKDNVPMRGRRPTTAWEPGEVVADSYVLEVGSVPAGEYRLTVGMYDPETGDRLAAFDATGQRLPDDRIVLDTIEVK